MPAANTRDRAFSLLVSVLLVEFTNNLPLVYPPCIVALAVLKEDGAVRTRPRATAMGKTK